MASQKTLYRRMAAEADERRTVRPIIQHGVGYMNRHDRRAIASAKRTGRKLRNVSPRVLDAIEVEAAINAKRAALIESEAPT